MGVDARSEEGGGGGGEEGKEKGGGRGREEYIRSLPGDNNFQRKNSMIIKEHLMLGSVYCEVLFYFLRFYWYSYIGFCLHYLPIKKGVLMSLSYCVLRFCCQLPFAVIVICPFSLPAFCK